MLSATREVVTRQRRNAGIAGKLTGSDSDRDTNAATADSGENEVRRRNMRECEDAMMEDTASRRGYAPTAAWDEGNMIQAMARMKNPTIAWRFGDG